MRRPSAYVVYLALQGAWSLLQNAIFIALAVYYVQTVGLNPLQLVLVGTVLEVTVLVFEVPTGVLADTYSRRLSVIIGQLLVGVCFVIEGLAPLFGAILAAEVVRGVGETFISGALEAWIADEVGEAKAGQAFMRGAQVSQAASLVGVAAGAGLGAIHIALPIIAGGGLLMAVGLASSLLMRETGFRPDPHEERNSPATMAAVLGRGLGAVRERPLLLSILVIGMVFGGFSEGFDRLSDAHFLRDLRLPLMGVVQPVIWFGVISSAGMLLGLLVTEWVRRRLDTRDRHSLARSLSVSTALLSLFVIVFGLSRNFPLALAAYLLAGGLRQLQSPLYTTWLNQNVESRVRATVLSMGGQADALGQFICGPAIGALGVAVSLPAALVAAGAILAPALLLYRRILRLPAAEASDG
jgi:MFS transporter, DHA3 family, tetracycline resistance protein